MTSARNSRYRSTALLALTATSSRKIFFQEFPLTRGWIYGWPHCGRRQVGQKLGGSKNGATKICIISSKRSWRMRLSFLSACQSGFYYIHWNITLYLSEISVLMNLIMGCRFNVLSTNVGWEIFPSFVLEIIFIHFVCLQLVECYFCSGTLPPSSEKNA